MICFDNEFLTGLTSFLFGGIKPSGYNQYLIFSFATLLFSLLNSLIVLLIMKITERNLHEFEITFKNIAYWCLGSFLVAFYAINCKYCSD